MSDREQISQVIARFFGAFASGRDLAETLSPLFLAGAVIVKTCGSAPVAESLADFIAPRQALLDSGRLADFVERPGRERVEVAGDLAHWFGGYTKFWSEQGQPHAGAGVKSIQLVRRDGWRIVCVVWDDERPGFEIPEQWRA